LTLQWTDMGRWGKYIGRHRMPDGNSVRFWHAVAERYRHDPNVLLGLFASPHGVDWHTWLYGGVCTEESATRVIAYRAAGMQELYNTVRATGAKNVVVVPGCRNGYDLFGVIHGFAVRGKNIVYATHIFRWMKHWRENFEFAAARVPVLVAQWGGWKQNVGFTKRLLLVMTKEKLSWMAANFGMGPPWPALIKNWQYQPTTFGDLVKKALVVQISGKDGGK
ncbi:MAG: cellulase family glycosylhydrolase, partial [Phycisphaerae bacterium]